MSTVNFGGITGELQWDIFVVYLIFCVMFITCCCVSIGCMFLCSPSQNNENNQNTERRQSQGKKGVSLFLFLLLNLIPSQWAKICKKKCSFGRKPYCLPQRLKLRLLDKVFSFILHYFSIFSL